MMPASFQERVCRHLGVPAERYDETVLRLTLYPHARWLCWFGSGRSSWLAPDRVFVAEMGRITRWNGFADVARDYIHDARNRGFLRRRLRLRVSVLRMRLLFSEAWGEPTPTDPRRSQIASTNDPFGISPE